MVNKLCYFNNKYRKYFCFIFKETIIKKIELKLHIIIYQPLRSGRIWHKVNFYAEFNRFEFWVFLILD